MCTDVIDQTEAPKGHKAVLPLSEDRPCQGCAYHRSGLGCAKDSNVPCLAYRRADGQTVIFVKA